MLCTCSNPVLEILTVGHYAWKARKLPVAPRPFCALAFRLRGSGSLYCGGRRYELTPGCVLYVPQGLAYSHDYTDTDLLLFHFITAKNDPEPEVYRPANPEEMGRQFQKALDIWEEKGPGFLSRSMSQLYKILGLLAEDEARFRLPPHFLQAVRLLNERYRESSLRIGDICREAAISQTVFRELFRRHYGKTPVEYLTELRIEYARSLICADVPIETAALESGFSDAKYFCRVVRQRLGCTPRQLRSDIRG